MSGLAVRPISTQEAVIVSLRARILDGKIEPGVRLPELELAAEFGVARPTVRAAIQTLCHEGLLVREPNRSAHIPVLTREEILDLFSVRIPIECLVVRAVLERGASLERARAAIAGHGGAARRRRLEPGRRRRRRVPPRARRAVGSPRLERLYDSLAARSGCASPSCARAGPRRRRSARSTTRCSRCSSRGDVDAAEARMTRTSSARSATSPKPVGA